MAFSFLEVFLVLVKNRKHIKILTIIQSRESKNLSRGREIPLQRGHAAGLKCEPSLRPYSDERVWDPYHTDPEYRANAI